MFMTNNCTSLNGLPHIKILCLACIQEVKLGKPNITSGKGSQYAIAVNQMLNLNREHGGTRNRNI